MQISLVIPAHNEERTLEQSFKKVKKALGRLGSYEIIISDDGSTDGTSAIAERLARGSKVVHLYSKKRLGKGLALKRAFRAAKGKLIIFTDADLSADPRHLKNMADEIKKGADICIGSRFLKGCRIRRCLKRSVLSRGYISLSRLLFNTSITDFQCGLKAFSRKALPVALKAKDNSWFWDTEILIRAERRGLKISQIPVSWKETRNSSINLIKTSFYLFYKLLWLRLSI